MAMAPAIRSIATLSLSLLTLLASCGVLGKEDSGINPARIGQGDSREGYESLGYRSQSRSLQGLVGIRANLEQRAASPPLGLPGLPDPPSEALIDLGRRLFFDRRLSANKTLSCGMCHVPEQAFTQHELATPVGIEGRFVRRNAPALYNVGYRRLLFHDGRESDLSEQIWAPLLASNEMGNPDRAAVLTTVAADRGYVLAFDTLFDEGLNARTVGLALAGYQRALVSADSPFDRWFYGGDSTALEPNAKRGFLLFAEKQCLSCHQLTNSHAHFTDDNLHRTGVGYRSHRLNQQPVKSVQIAPGVEVPLSIEIVPPARFDEGLKEITGREADRWRYRTPSLRNVAITAPYMHDGSLATLDAVIEFYDRGGGTDPGKDPLLVPLQLRLSQRQDLEAFLRALTGSDVEQLTADARSTVIGDTSPQPEAQPEHRLE
jgi:cytochrome c peroxidase